MPTSGISEEERQRIVKYDEMMFGSEREAPSVLLGGISNSAKESFISRHQIPIAQASEDDFVNHALLGGGC